MLIWFGKSLRPVATTAAPAACATSGWTSGTGFASANTIAWGAIADTTSTGTVPDETPMNTIPAASSMLAIATPAAPAPDITTRISLRVRPVTIAALVSAAVTTTAVPCWSSWNTGMSSRSCSRRSISKHRGALMSSRLIPP